MEEKQNFKLIIAVVVISILVFVAWDAFFLKPLRDEAQKEQQSKQVISNTTNNNSSTSSSSSSSMLSFLTGGASRVENGLDQRQLDSDKTALQSNKRILINNNNIKGSINLVGATVDSAILINYKQTTDKNSEDIALLHPKGTPNAYFYESGFVSTDSSIDLPNSKTLWKANNTHLSESSPVTLTYTNKQGIVFKKFISIDKNYMIKVEDSIVNNTNKNIVIYPWALISRHGEPHVQDIFISHEGIVGYLNNVMEEVKYGDVRKASELNYNSKGGFIGFADKYFMVSLIPENNNINVKLRYFTDNTNTANYQIDYIGNQVNINSKAAYSNATNLFVGPKEYNLLSDYSVKYNIPKFDDAIDFGWFYFITKPFLSILLLFYHFFNNFGYAMLAFTVIIRLCIFPITYTSYLSMAKMRKIQPQMQLLKEKHAGDMQKYNQALMALYKKEKVNPLAGCLPLLIQIPILFSIYKVIYICIEMRHAPFLWIKDLSDVDPTSLFNLFGLLPYDVPNFLNIGFWAIFMGVTMFFQQKLSNTTFVNEMQKRIMNWFPVIITIVLAHFPVGLIIYWGWSNVISIIQQLFINRIVKKRHG
ncbi:membrane protein insertase YidC [Rickettsiales bacterium LUAb2]